ncbi:MAG: DMT family transporter [Deltaproteobacteria bacterium]|jgi:drug/metabolite transporter (DMT)-like permease|nr:DMT family transporter [Deltaproteobacteria bacterium]
MKAWQADLAIIGAATIWGMSFIFTRWGLEESSPALFLTCRFGLAMIVSIFIFGHKLHGLSQTTAKRGLLLGLLMGGGYLLQNYSVNFTEVPRAAFIASLTLPAIPIVSFILFREKIKKHNLIGVIMALIGVYFLLDPSFEGVNSGDIIALLSVPLWALYLIYMNIFTKDLQGQTCQLLVLQFMGALPLTIIVAVLFETGLWTPLHPDLAKGITFSTHFWMGLLYCSLLASIGIVFIQTACQKYTTPVQAMLCFQFEPVTASAGAWLFLNETVGVIGVVGSIVIIMGVLTSELGGLMSAPDKKSTEL